VDSTPWDIYLRYHYNYTILSSIDTLTPSAITGILVLVGPQGYYLPLVHYIPTIHGITASITPLWIATSLGLIYIYTIHGILGAMYPPY
jgi:hypothetical protein